MADHYAETHLVWYVDLTLIVNHHLFSSFAKLRILGHFAVSILPMCIFGPISLLCWLYAMLEALLVTVYASFVGLGICGGNGSKKANLSGERGAC